MSEKVKGIIKSFPFELKQYDDEKRIIEGYVSTKDIDRVDDIVEPEAFKSSLEIFIKNNGVVLFNHRYDFPIGKVVSAVIDKKGLLANIELAKSVEKAEEVWALIKQGILKNFSFGFIPKEVEMKNIEDKEVRVIKSLEMLEISIVSVPANINAVFSVSEGKAIDIEFETKENPFEKQKSEEGKAASGSTNLQLADEGRSWDKTRAVNSVRKWASSDGSGDKDKINWSKYRKAFFWYNEKDPENFGAYKLPFAEVIDGQLKAVPRGIMAAAAAIQGARGGVNIPSSDIGAVKAKIASYYKKMGKTPPWKKGYYDCDEIELVLKECVSETISDVVEKLNKIDKQFEEIKKELTELKNIKQNNDDTEEIDDKLTETEDEFFYVIHKELSKVMEILKQK